MSFNSSPTALREIPTLAYYYSSRPRDRCDIFKQRKKISHTHTHTCIHFCVVQFRTYAAGGSGSEPELVLMILSSFLVWEFVVFAELRHFPAYGDGASWEFVLCHNISSHHQLFVLLDFETEFSRVHRMPNLLPQRICSFPLQRLHNYDASSTSSSCDLLLDFFFFHSGSLLWDSSPPPPPLSSAHLSELQKIW